MDYLNVDVIMEILSHLPVKSLLRFQSVCRRWNIIINNQQFITKHSKIHNPTNISCLLFINLSYKFDANELLLHSSLRHERNYNTIISNYAQILHLSPTTICPMPKYIWNGHVIGPCNGLVCVFVEFYHGVHLILLNPSTRKIKNLMHHSFIRRDPGQFEGLGFGYDPMSKEFKVITFRRRLNNLDRICVQIYYVWKNYSIIYEYPDEYLIPTTTCEGVAFNQSCCWLALGNNILSFDFSQEVFTTTPFPLHAPELEVSSVRLKILAFRDAIALTALHHDISTGSSYSSLVIWTRKDLTERGSWTKFAKIDPILGDYRVLAFWRNFHYLILEDFINDNVVSYHICLLKTKLKTKKKMKLLKLKKKTKKIKMLETNKMKLGNMRYLDHWAFEYTETLVPVSVTKSATKKSSS